MKIKITFKDPDGVSDAILDCAQEHAAKLPTEFLDCTEDVADTFQQQIKLKLSHWIEYNEYLTVEFDLDAMTARILTKREE